MVTSRALYLGFLLLLAAERLFEVALSRRNVARALARGGRESGQAHFPVMVALHTAFLASCAVESAFRPFPFMLLHLRSSTSCRNRTPKPMTVAVEYIRSHLPTPGFH